MIDRVITEQDAVDAAKEWVSPKLFRSATITTYGQLAEVWILVRTTRWSLGVFNRRIEKELQELYGARFNVRVRSFG